MADHDGLLDIVAQCHDAAAGRGTWQSALETVATFFGATAATLEIYEQPSLAYRFFESHGIPEHSVADYAAYYAALNPRIRHGLGTRPGHAVHDYQHIDDRAMDRHEFYIDFLRPMDLRYHLATNLQNDVQSFSGFSVQFSERQGPATDRDIDCILALSTHVNQALDVHQRLQAADGWSRSLREATQWMREGLVLLDTDGAVVHANAAAAAIFAQLDGLTCVKRRLVAASKRVHSALERAVGAATMVHERIEPAPAAEFIVPRRSPGLPYVVAVRPLLAHRTAGRHRAAVAVFIRDPMAGGPLDRRALVRHFALSPAEARLAEALMEGMTLKQFAGMRGVTVNTVRTQLAQIAQKLGVRRQADIVRVFMALRSPAATPPGPDEPTS